MLVKFQHTVFYDILSTSNIKKIVNNKITCYCCGEQFTISSEFSLHKRNLHIINTIIYLCIKQSCIFAIHKRNIRTSRSQVTGHRSQVSGHGQRSQVKVTAVKNVLIKAVTSVSYSQHKGKRYSCCSVVILKKWLWIKKIGIKFL